MFFDYVRQFRHDRRRIIFSMVLTVVSLACAGDLLPDPFFVPSEILLGAFFFALIPLFTACYRTKRAWIEVCAIANIIVALLGHITQGGFFAWNGVMYALTLQIPAYLCLAVSVRAALYGNWSENWAPRSRYTVTASLKTHIPLKDLWYGMVPTPGYINRNPDPEVVSISYTDATKTSVRLTTWMPPRAGTGEALMEFVEHRPYEYVHFRLRIIEGLHDPTAEGDTELTMSDHGTHRVLHIRHKVNAFTPRRALMAYFDDTFGRMIAARLAAVEKYAVTGRPTKSRTGVNEWFLEQGVVGTARHHDKHRHRTAYGRAHSEEETDALKAVGRS